MIKREEYMDFLLKLKDKHIIKVVTGIRRCGKSTLFELYKENLQKNGVSNRVNTNFCVKCGTPISSITSSGLNENTVDNLQSNVENVQQNIESQINTINQQANMESQVDSISQQANMESQVDSISQQVNME